MLGSDLMVAFSEFDPTGWDRKEIDITDQQQINSKIRDLSPDIIINSAAYTQVDKAEDEKDLAREVNGEAVGYLAEVAKEMSAVLIHYSTDYVFDGMNKEGYLEDDKPNPIGAYGSSKLLGEKKLLGSAEMFYLIRVSWLYGKKGKNFVRTMLDLAKEKDEISVVDDQFGKPTYTKDVALATKELIIKKYPCGIYHFPNEGETSWYNFAQKIFKLAKSDIEVKPIKTEEYPIKAVRPKYSTLLNTKFPLLRNWPEAVQDYLGEIGFL